VARDVLRPRELWLSAMIFSVFMVVYRLLWIPLLPVIVIYLWYRGRGDPDYFRHLPERFGVYKAALPKNALWIHVVSLGETRSATGLIRLALARGDRIVLTHFTPAGRRESARLFGAEIASGQLAAVWVPFDMSWCYRRFFRACTPLIGLTFEIEIWPAMIASARRANVPLYMCNAQYPSRSLARDSRGLRLRQRLIPGFAGAFVKSQAQADRFARVGLRNITVTGELRFDQPVPDPQVVAALRFRELVGGGRDIVTIASGVEGEEVLFADMMVRLKKRETETGSAAPLFVYVPRAPERFGVIAEDLRAAGLSVLRRSEALDADLRPRGQIEPPDVFLGDSLGEMFFYLAMGDRVIVGGGFTPRGAHNVIEPLMTNKTVLTGPYVWTIEFPFVEAEAAGVATSLPDADALLAELAKPPPDASAAISAFLSEHRGASVRTLAGVDAALAGRRGAEGR
jgi:3-deoxy-D-manno-octulosonic-acid transferase